MADRGHKPGTGIASMGRGDMARRIHSLTTVVGHIPTTYKVVDDNVIDSKGRKTPLKMILSRAKDKGLSVRRTDKSLTLARMRAA